MRVFRLLEGDEKRAVRGFLKVGDISRGGVRCRGSKFLENRLIGIAAYSIHAVFEGAAVGLAGRESVIFVRLNNRRSGHKAQFVAQPPA